MQRGLAKRRSFKYTTSNSIWLFDTMEYMFTIASAQFENSCAQTLAKRCRLSRENREVNFINDYTHAQT